MIEKIREVLRLKERGYTQSQIIEATGISRTCVQKYLRLCRQNQVSYRLSTELTDKELKSRLGVELRGRDRREVADPDFADIRQQLSGRKGVHLELLWKEWVDSSPDSHYSYSTFCRRYREWLGHQKVWMRQDYPGGEKALVDYSGETLTIHPFTSKEPHKVEIFVGILGASNYVFCEAAPSQALEHWQSSHIRMFEHFGGVTRCVIIDNLKSGVLQPDRYEPVINHSYQQLADHYDTTILPARVAKAQDKGKVEQAVQLVQRHILAPLRHKKFRSIGELNEAIKPLLKALNARVMRTYGASRQTLYEDLDRPNLTPLPPNRFVPQTWHTAKVSLDYHIQIENHYYSVPYHLARKEVQVKVTEKLVEVFYENERVASHKRSRDLYQHTTVIAHMPPNHRFQKSQTKAKFLNWAKGAGPEIHTLVERLLFNGSHPEQGFRSILGLQRLEKKYGTALLEQAARMANKNNIISQRYVRTTIESILAEQNTTKEPLCHENLRGAEYYH